MFWVFGGREGGREQTLHPIPGPGEKAMWLAKGNVVEAQGIGIEVDRPSAADQARGTKDMRTLGSGCHMGPRARSCDQITSALLQSLRCQLVFASTANGAQYKRSWGR